MLKKNPEIAIISDLHFGVHGDSPKWHGIMLEYVKWLSKLLKERGTTDLFILGDVFDNRKAVGVETMQMAHDFFMEISRNGLRIVIIAGNHDSYFEDTAKTTSVSLLASWPGVELVDRNPVVKVWGYEPVAMARAVLCPWGTDMRAMAESGEKYDVVMGHFAISSFADVPGHLYTGGYTPEEITECAPLVFSGHFHLRDDKTFMFGGKKKRIVIVGSPYQLNWADAGSTKGVYFVNMLTKDIDFVENTVSPKHIQVNVGDDVGEEVVRNNIVRVMANSVEEAKQVEGFIEGLRDFGAVDIGAKISAVDTAMPEGVLEQQVGGVFDQHQMMLDYIKACGFGDKEQKVVEIMERLYGAAMASRKENV